MESLREILRHYRFGPADDENRRRLGELLLPEADALAEAFYDYLAADPYTASFFPTEAAAQRRRATLREWFHDLFTARLDGAHLRRLERVGKVHVRIGLSGHHVNAAMNFVRSFCTDALDRQVPDGEARASLQSTLHKLLDLNLDVLTGSYREEEMRRVFLSPRLESGLVRWTERLVHGLNLVLVVGLLAMAAGITVLFLADVVSAFEATLEKGLVKAMGSLLILWMMIELLHAEVRYLRGGNFEVKIFLELALVAFIRKLFVAALEKTEPVGFALLLGGLLVLGLLLFLVSRLEPSDRRLRPR